MNPVAPMPHRRTILAGLCACLAAGPILARVARAQPAEADLTTRLHDEVFKDLNLSDTAQSQLGRELSRRLIDRAGGIYLNPAAQAALTDFARTVFNHAARKSLSWEVTIVDNDIPTAWVLPGGQIAIYKGLLRYMATPDALAAVIAHEMGHVEAGDLVAAMRDPGFTDRIPREDIPALLNAVRNDPVRGILSPPALTILERPIFDVVRAGYGPDREAAADKVIVNVFAASGHDPALAATAFETIAALVPEGATATTCLYSGSESTAERATLLRTYAPVNGEEPPGTPGFDIVKSVFPTRHHFGYRNRDEATP